MDFKVLTIFPEMFDIFWNYGIIKKAVEQNRISVKAVNIRDFTHGVHLAADDRPYGGGSGMVIKPEPLAKAIRSAKAKSPKSAVVLLSPQGFPFKQQFAAKLAKLDGLILICGRYEGIDERICDEFVDFEISIGDYILTGGELAAMTVMDSVARLLPGVLGNSDSAAQDSFSDVVLEYAHYTRPRVFEGNEVPEVLLSGNHKKIEKWRLESSIKRTFLKRPDLLLKKKLTKEEIQILQKWNGEIENIICKASM